MADERKPRAVPPDYDEAPERFRLARSTQRRHGANDIHEIVARRLIDEDLLPVLDVGCGEGELARHLPPGAWTGVDSSSAMLASAPEPTVRADAGELPFDDESFGSVTLLYVLYHLEEPLAALREARRVLRPGGLIAVAVPSRHDSPELAFALPHERLTFDAELAPELLADVFDDIETQPWDAPLLMLPTRGAVRDYLVGKGVERGRAEKAATEVAVPLTVTKRGALTFAHKR
jgi:SAM-dependent methyltransferase